MPDVGSAIKALNTLPPDLLLFVFAVFLSYLCRRVPFIPNKWIVPVTILLSFLAYSVLAEPFPGKTDLWNYVHKLIIGTMVGGIGTLMGIGVHDKMLKPLAAKFPFLALLTCEDNDESDPPPSDKPTTPDPKP